MHKKQPKNVYELVRSVRRQENLKQYELGKLLGFRQSALSMFENGRDGALSQDKKKKLFDELGLTNDPIVKEYISGLRNDPTKTKPDNIDFQIAYAYTTGEQTYIGMPSLDGSRLEDACRVETRLIEAKRRNMGLIAALRDSYAEESRFELTEYDLTEIMGKNPHRVYIGKK